MHPAFTVFSSLLAGAVGAIGITWAGPSPEPSPRVAAIPDALTARIDALAAELERLSDPSSIMATRVNRVGRREEAIATVVRRILSERSDAPDVEEALGSASGGDDLVALAGRPSEALDVIRARGLDSPAARDIWSALDQADRLEDVLDLVRADAERAPNSVDAQFELARAVHAAAVARPNHAEGRWWYESDQAYDRVLELDANQHEARFRKASNLTFWPASFGRMPEAIRHFEALIEQRSGGADLLKRQRSSFLTLGNIYAQQGNHVEARTVWERGLRRFSGDGDLQARLKSLPR